MKIAEITYPVVQGPHVDILTPPKCWEAITSGFIV